MTLPEDADEDGFEELRSIETYRGTLLIRTRPPPLETPKGPRYEPTVGA